jgi:dolichol-phosphate mannosyltransferase
LAVIVIADGSSSDGATEPAFLQSMGVRTLLTTDEPGLGTATRMGVAYAMDQGYDGIVTIDGNGKDGVEALPQFLTELDRGYDLVQGSRFMKGGIHRHTPWDRQLAIRFIMAPLIAWSNGFRYTDPTNAFRALSMRYLADPRVQPVRDIFVRFDLQIYFIYRAPKLGFAVKEIPVTRVYPSGQPVPTKITSLRLKLLLVRELLAVIFGHYDPKN